MYSFLRRPIWILSHVLIALLIIVLVSLGFWQRSRYYEEKGIQERLEAAATAVPEPLDDVVNPQMAIDAVPEGLAYRRVRVSGHYDTTNEVLINNRSLDGSPGAWVLTPLVRDDGGAVAVVRGWVPLAVAEKGVPVAAAPAPGGPVGVTGVVQLTQVRGSLGPVDPDNGHLDQLARVDLARLATQLPYELDPAWVLLDGQDPPPAGDLPALVKLQPNDPSQNFSYMFQWWIFASIALVGYPLILRSVARNRVSGSTRRSRREQRGSADDEIPWAAGLGPTQESAPAEPTSTTASASTAHPRACVSDE